MASIAHQVHRSLEQVGDRKGVSKTVRVALPDLNFFSQRTEQLPQPIPVHGTVVFPDEQWLIGIGPIFPLRQIAPQESPGGFPHIDCASLSSLGLALHERGDRPYKPPRGTGRTRQRGK